MDGVDGDERIQIIHSTPIVRASRAWCSHSRRIEARRKVEKSIMETGDGICRSRDVVDGRCTWGRGTAMDMQRSRKEGKERRKRRKWRM